MQYLTQKELKAMMLLSYQRVEREKENINKINVFPIPDQDTGNNITKTLLGIKEAIENKDFKDTEELTEAILDGALTAAQGNAGVIYTGFLARFLPQLKKGKSGNKDLALAFEEGLQGATSSIQSPKEGTILDVIAATMLTFKEQAGKEDDILKVLKLAIKKASQALLDTREKMPILKKANVVDAGGLGFLIILESFLAALEEKEEIVEKEIKEKSSEKIKRFVQIISNRYEVVSLIKNPKLSFQEIKDRFKRLGNSLDMVQIGNKVKIHIHTDFPDEAKQVMQDLGDVESMVIEDMSNQVIGENLSNSSIGIITDELADLTQKIAERYQISVIPHRVNWPESESLSGKNIYQKMQEAERRGFKSLPKTSRPPKEIFLEEYKKLLEKFENVLCVPLSSKLSGSYNSACQARSMLSEEKRKRVFVLDSYSVSGGEALLILKAIELIQEGFDIHGIISKLKRKIPTIYLYGLLANPKWIEWGGRINSRQAAWIRRFQKLGASPLLGIKEGRVEKIGYRFGIKETSEGLFREIKKKSKKVRDKGKKIRVVIAHCDNIEEANKLKQKLKKIKAEVSFIGLTGPVLGAHVGPGALIATWTTI